MNDEHRRLAERLALAGSPPPGLAREQERTGQRREALAALAGVLAQLHGQIRCETCASGRGWMGTRGQTCDASTRVLDAWALRPFPFLTEGA